MIIPLACLCDTAVQLRSILLSVFDETVILDGPWLGTAIKWIKNKMAIIERPTKNGS